MKKIILSAAALLAAISSQAGGLLTNTNQSASFLRNPARDGVIAIDGVYSNPAGVAFLPDGWHFEINNQSAFQTRTIVSGMQLPDYAGTPFERPMALNADGNERGEKKFKGEASAPILPSVFVAHNRGKWGFQGGFGVVGGGGKATFDQGLGSFERQVSLLPGVLAIANSTYLQRYGLDLGLGSNTPGYSVDSYIHGQQYVFGLQLGATYKVHPNVAVYAGFRFDYTWNKYKGSITNITANINGVNENLYNFLGLKAEQLNAQAASYQEQSNNYALLAEQAAMSGDAAAAERYRAAAEQLAAGAQLSANGATTMSGYRNQVADKYLDCTQRGWAIDPIIGVDWHWNKLNVGARLEFTTHFNVQNDTKRDDTGLFTDGVNTPGDIPGLATLGVQYELLPNLRVMGGYHYFFDKNADMADDKQKLLGGNTMEYNFGVEWDPIKNLTVSAGMQRTKYDLADGAYLTDMSFVTSSYSVGLGATVQLNPRMRITAGYFWTNYSTFDKVYTQEISLAGQTITANNTDSFTRTNKVFGVGFGFDL